jgi:hypothetical protein
MGLVFAVIVSAHSSKALIQAAPKQKGLQSLTILNSSFQIHHYLIWP